MSDDRVETWASSDLENETFRMGFASRALATVDLVGRTGEVLRYEHGIPRDGLEQVFKLDQIIENLQEFLANSDVLGDHEGGLVDVSDQEQETLQRRLVDALMSWSSEINLPVWTIVERHEVLTDQAE